MSRYVHSNRALDRKAARVSGDRLRAAAGRVAASGDAQAADEEQDGAGEAAS